MQKRRLGRSDLYLTPLGFGTWAIGGPWAFGWGPQDDPYCAAHGIGVVAYGPLAYGLLTGKYTRAQLEDLPADDWRRRGARFQEPELSANLAFVEGLRRIAEGERCSLAGLAIAWVLRRPEITSAIVGARSPAQIAETVKNDHTLSAEVLGDIERLLDEREGLCRERRPVEGP
jgi:aryl-alcohol dehydrogenase-like predicted oxidoreductase